MRDALPGAKQSARPEDAGEKCPSCGSPVREGDIICVRCGTNLLTGQKIADEQQEVIKSARNRQPLLIGLVAVAVLAVVIAGGAYVLLQNPIAEAEKLEAEGRRLEAIEVLREFAAAHPERADAQMLLGKLNWRATRYEEAANAFDAAFDAAPTMAEPGRLAVVAASRLVGSDGGRRQLEALQRLVERHPDDTRARRMLALAQGTRGDTAGQAAALEALVTQEPEDGAAMAFLAVARALNGDTAGAAEALASAERLGARDIQALRGFLAALQGQNAAARTDLAAAGQSPGPVSAYVQARLGLLLLAEGDYQGALGAFNAAQASPEIADVVSFFRALCLKELGLQAEALAGFEQVSASESELAADAAIQTALIHMEGGELVRAEEALRRATQYGAASAQFHTAQGRLQNLNGQPAQARQSLDNATRLDSQYPAAHLESGLLYLKRQVEEDGIRELERYVQLAGKDNPRGRVGEIEMLVDQLRQSLDSAQAVAGPAV